jgi:hypothetical protein
MKHIWDTLCRGLILTILLSSLLLIASAETVSYCDSIPMQMTDWNSSVSLPKFDPDMGVLKAVDISIDVNLSQQVKAENLEKSNSSISTTIEPVLVLILPNTQEIKANASLASSRDLAPFDGVNDFSGSSGINFTESSSSGTANYQIREVSDFVAASPGEMLLLRGVLEGRRRTVSDSGVFSNIRIVAGARVCVSYQYEAVAYYKGDLK